MAMAMEMEMEMETARVDCSWMTIGTCPDLLEEKSLTAKRSDSDYAFGRLDPVSPELSDCGFTSDVISIRHFFGTRQVPVELQALSFN